MTSPISEQSLRERKFHDEWAKHIQIGDIAVIKSFEAITAVENRYILKELGQLRGKTILDLGCGAGEAAVYFSLKGAKVFACDISMEFVNLAKALADKFNVKPDIRQADACHLPYADWFFDFVYGNGVLHHVNLLMAIGEIRRVLKTGGKAAFIEPLPYNPLINVYRNMAKEVRSQDEAPISFAAMHRCRPHFTKFTHREFWLCTLLIFLDFFFVRRWHPSRVRYWKRVIEASDAYEKKFSFLKNMDDVVLKYLPFLKPLCWNSVIIGVK